MRGPEIYPPEPSVADDRTVQVTIRELRELAAGIDELLRFNEGMDCSDVGDEPEELLFLRAASDRLAQMLGKTQHEDSVNPESRKLGILGA